MINSMTGFASKQIQNEFGMFSWEVRSVNHRYLDISFKLPESFRSIEAALREKSQVVLSRGKIDCFFKFVSNSGKVANGILSIENVKLNTQTLESLSGLFDQVHSVFGDRLSIKFSDVLAWPGIIETAEIDFSNQLNIALELFEETLKLFCETRSREGQKISEMLLNRIDEIEHKIISVKKELPIIQEDHRRELIEKIEIISKEYDKSRIEQELLYWAERVDVSEEIDRLIAHLSEIRHILTQSGSIGKRLDFMMQELNREINTFASKSSNDKLTRTAVDIKVLIEQMREQIQNVE